MKIHSTVNSPCHTSAGLSWPNPSDPRHLVLPPGSRLLKQLTAVNSPRHTFADRAWTRRADLNHASWCCHRNHLSWKNDPAVNSPCQSAPGLAPPNLSWPFPVSWCCHRGEFSIKTHNAVNSPWGYAPQLATPWRSFLGRALIECIRYVGADCTCYISFVNT